MFKSQPFSFFEDYEDWKVRILEAKMEILYLKNSKMYLPLKLKQC